MSLGEDPVATQDRRALEQHPWDPTGVKGQQKSDRRVGRSQSHDLIKVNLQRFYS